MSNIPQSSKNIGKENETDTNNINSDRDDRHLKSEDGKSVNNEDFINDEVYIRIKDGSKNVQKVNKHDRGWGIKMFGYPGQKHKQELWVQYFGMSKLETESTPLEYDGSRNNFVLIVMYMLFIMILATIFMHIYLDMLLPKDGGTYKFFKGVGGRVVAVLSMLSLIGMHVASAYVPMLRLFYINAPFLILSFIFHNLFWAHITIVYETRMVYFIYCIVGSAVLHNGLLAAFPFNFKRISLYVYDFVILFFATIIFMATYKVTDQNHFLSAKATCFLTTLPSIVFLCIKMELQALISGRVLDLGTRDYTLAAFYCFTSYIDIFIKVLQLINSIYE